MGMPTLEVVLLVLVDNTKADFARAVIEGITYSLYDSIKIMREAGHEINSITSIGGGLKVSSGFNFKQMF